MGGAYLLGLAAAALSGGISGAVVGFAAGAGVSAVCVPPYVAVAALVAASGSAGIAAVERLARR